MRLALAVAVGLTAPLGCNLLLDIGDHHLGTDSGAGAGASGGGTSATGGAGGGGAGPGGAGGAGGAGGCWRAIPVVIASGQVHPTVIRVADMNVFWINEATAGSPGAIMKAPKEADAGAPTPLVPSISNPRGLWLGTQILFFSNDIGPLPGQPGLFKRAKADTGSVIAVDIGDGFGAGALQASGTYAYTAASAPDQTLIRRSSLGGPTGGCYPYHGGPGTIDALAVDVARVYFSDPAGPNVLRTLSLACDAGAQLFAANPDGTAARAIKTVNDDVFWVTATQVLKGNKLAVGAEPTILATDQKGPRDLTLLRKKIVFTNEEDGTVRSVDPDTKEVCVLASGQGGPHGLADDNQSLFWTNYDSGEIVRYDPP